MNDHFKKRLSEIIIRSFSTLEMKIANEGVIAKNEASFQLELGYILKVFGQLYEFKPNEKFNLQMERHISLQNHSIKSKSKNARIDIFLEFGNGKESASAAIELKFFKRKNHREPNNRYDVFKDLSNLEAYKENGIDLCFLFLWTDHSHYVKQKDYSLDTKDFDIRNGSKYTAGTVLNYNTPKPYGIPIELKGSYDFQWNEPIDQIYFTTIEV